jgi:RHS repeat-associated protein
VPLFPRLTWRAARRVVQATALVTAPVLAVTVSGGTAGAMIPGPGAGPTPKSTTHAPTIPRDKRIAYQWQVPRKSQAPRPFKKYDPTADSKLPGPGTATVDLTAATAGATGSTPAAGASPASAGLRRAGGLPVLVGPAPARPGGKPAGASGAAGPARLTVQVTDQKTAQAAGIHGILFSVASASTGAGSAMVAVDDSSFAAAFGGNYAARLHLARLPACALTTPRLARCQAQTPVRPVAAGTPLTAQVAVGQLGTAAGSMTVLAATSGPSGSSGDYSATSLSPAGTWSAGGNTGSFDYSYPIAVPASIAGSTPNVDLSYDSSSQDGRTEGTNNQSSGLGDGWTSAENYIERSYQTCSDDPASGAPQYSGDECWKGQVLTLSLNGQSTPIVYDDATQTFRPVNDSSTTKIENLTTCQNGTYNNECWRVTENGVQYYFGLNQLPGWSSGRPVTQSAWTVPVYGAHAADPCHAATFAASSCVQGWRWNLDYVVDLHGNAAAYYYTPEYNNYGADMATTPVKYTRGGYLTRIDYGMSAGTVYSATAPEQILFNVAERCIPGVPAGNTCADSQFTVANAAYWPDVPIDQDCWSNNATSCPDHGPTYWSRKRLTSIVTQVQVNGATQKVDEYDLTQSFPDGGDHAPTLWLDSIQRTGLDTSAGGSSTVPSPPVSFDPPLQLPNRVGAIAKVPQLMYHDRIQNITTETGAKITVTYNPATCTPANVPANPAGNTANCFPVYWTPYGYTSPQLDWFQKYTVSQVLTQDLHNANPDGSYPELLTSYKYPASGAAWHYDDNELVKAQSRTYGQFRGYAWVEVLTGDPNVFHYTNGVKVYDQQTLTKTTYLRGMSSDTPSGTGGTTVTVTSSDSKYSVTDSNPLSGQAFETDTYTDATGSTLYAAKVNVPAIIGPTASRARSGLPPLTAQMVRTSHTYARQAVSYSPGWRYTETGTFYNTTLGQPTTGMPVQADDRGETADPGNIAKCTWTRYAENPAETLVLPAETITSAQDCATAGATQTGPVISDTRTSYDGHAFTWDGASPAGDAPTKGDATTTARASGPTGIVTASAFTTLATTTYDSYGRVLVVTRTPDSTAPNGSSLAQTTTTSYTPASGALPTQTRTKVQVTAGSSPAYQTSTTTLDPARNLPVEKIDAAGLKTDLSYDAIGRATAVWLPNESKAAGAPANDTFSYSLSQTAPSVVAAGKLLDNGSYLISETLYDSLLRPRETQVMAENSGMIVTDTQYDSLGQTVLANKAYAVTGAPGAALVSAAPASIPDTTVTDYDAMGRADLVTEEHDGVKTWATTTAYAGDHTTVIPPPGGVTQTTYTNSRGQTTTLDQYTTAPAVTGTAQAGYAASGGTFDQTSYTYAPGGQQATVTGPDKAAWSFTYDLLGRKIQQSDPDVGATKYGYDVAGDLVSTTDARNVELDYTYDLLGRKLTAADKNNGGFEFASWLYDTLQAGKLTSETRYVPGVSGGYTVATTGYTSLGKPTGTTITLPASEAPLPTSYTTSYAYSVNSQALISQSDPRTQGLAGETITYGHDALGNPTTTGGINTYVGATVYTSHGEPSRITLGDSTNPAYLTYTYDDQTRRLTGVQADRTQAPGPTVDNTSYTYDASGNPTSVTDQQSESGTTVTDTQCYTYDSLSRLTQAWTDTAGVNPAGAGGIGGCQTAAPSATTLATGPTAYWQSYQYNTAGGRTAETDHVGSGATGDTTTTYTNGGTPAGACADATTHPHSLTQTSTAGPTGTTTTSFCYDASGDTLSRTPSAGTAQSLAWDHEGHLASVAQGSQTTRYLYDADGNQLIRRDPGQTTLFAGDTKIVVNTSVTPNVLLGAVRTYSIGGTGAAIAVRSSLPGGGVDYLLGDPHGTATMAMDITTQAVSRKQYTPYGQVRGAASATWPDPTRGYLAKPVDAATGYTDLGARKYDPALGRFISPDPVLETSSPQQLGGYTYAADNPVTSSDPSGLRACVDSCNGGGGGAAPGNGNTDQGTSAADQCWGPGGNWICGSGSAGGGSPAPGPVVYSCLPGTFGCSGPLQAQPSGSPSSSSGGGGLWHWVTHTALPALGKVTGVTDAIDCIKNPTWGGCTKAVVKLAVTGTVIVTVGSSLGVGASVDGTLGGADAAIQGGDAAAAAEGGGWVPSTSADLQAAVRGANKPELSAVQRLACGIAAWCAATVPGVTSSDVSAQWAIPASIKEVGPDIPEIAREIDSSSATGIGSGPGIIPEGGGIPPPSPTDNPTVWVGPWVP